MSKSLACTDVLLGERHRVLRVSSTGDTEVTRSKLADAATRPGGSVSMRKTAVSDMTTRGPAPFLGLRLPARSVLSRPHSVSFRCFWDAAG